MSQDAKHCAQDAKHYAQGFRFVVLDERGKVSAYTHTRAEALSEAKRTGGTACALQQTRQNPTVRRMEKPTSYFYKEVRKYGGWGDAWCPSWWREALQNSIDAVRGKGRGADKTIELEAHKAQAVDSSGASDGTQEWTVSCLDHGGGMTEEVFFNAFFTAGGTDKPEGAVGGFGEAKLLLLCPWKQWSVRTQDFEAVGHADECTEVIRRPRIDGTVLKAVMRDEFYVEGRPMWITIEHAKRVLARSHLPDFEFVCNGEAVKTGLPPGRVVRGPQTFKVNVTDDRNRVVKVVEAGYTIHHKEPTQAQVVAAMVTGVKAKIVYRIGGLFMFEQDAPEGVVNDIIIELSGASKYILNPNRTQITNHEIERAIQAFIEEVTVNGLSALSDKRGSVRQYFRNAGKFKAALDSSLKAAEQAGAIVEQAPKSIEHEQKLSDEQRAAILEARAKQQEEWRRQEEARKSREAFEKQERDARIARGEIDPEPDAKQPKEDKRMQAATPEVAAEMTKVQVQDQKQLRAMLAQLAWRPDYVIENNLARMTSEMGEGVGTWGWSGELQKDQKPWKVPKEFLPETMSQRVQRLLVVWTELCRFCLIQLSCGEPYGVGFVFSHQTNGLTIYKTGEGWLLLNPYKDRSTDEGHEGKAGGGMKVLFDPDNVADIKHMYAVAIHECTHFATHLFDHNEYFSSAMTENVAQCADGWRLVRRIAKKATGEEQEVDVPVEGLRGDSDEESGGGAGKGGKLWEKLLHDEDSPDDLQAQVDRIKSQIRQAKAEQRRLTGESRVNKPKGIPREVGRLLPWPDGQNTDDYGADAQTVAAGKQLFDEIRARVQAVDESDDRSAAFGPEHSSYNNLSYALYELGSALGHGGYTRHGSPPTETGLRRKIEHLRKIRDEIDPPPYRHNELGVHRPWPHTPLDGPVCTETRKAARRLIDEIKAWHPRNSAQDLPWQMDDAIDSLERSAGLSATDQEKYYQESEGAVRERMTKLREFRDQNAPTEEMGRRRERQEELDRLQEAYNARTEELNRSTTNFTKVRDERDQYREAAARLEAQMQETIQTQQAALADMQRKIDEAAEAAMAKVRVQAEASYARAQQAVDKVLSHEISMPSARSAVSSVRSSVTTAHSASTAATGSARIVWQTPVQQGDGYVYVGKYVGQYAGDVSGKAAGSEVCRITWSPSKGTILRTAKGERACKNVAEAKLIAQGGI